MNFFRVPLNLYVVVLLLKVKHMEVSSAFLIITATHIFGFLMYLDFNRRRNNQSVALPDGAAAGDKDLGDKAALTGV